MSTCTDLPESAPVSKCIKSDTDLMCELDPAKSKSVGILRSLALLMGFLIIQFAYYAFCFIGLLYSLATGSIVTSGADITWIIIILFGSISFVMIAYAHQYRTKKRRVGYYLVAIYFVVFGLSLYSMYLADWLFWASGIEIIIDTVIVHTYPVGLLFMIGLTCFVLAWYTIIAESRIKQDGLELCTVISMPTSYEF